MYTRTTFSDFVYNYYIGHRAEFDRYKTPEEFANGFSITPQLYKTFLDYAAKDNIKVLSITAHDEPEIKTRLKAMFARQLWRAEGFYQVSNSSDQVIKKR
ncbi:hypothetical protein MKQ70_18900 [Chitinophaga sedimenti]|uniref:hypothetical protein n=1 Tax=Chitinophaga sedimenti TaxID=2033606 RepID=UPI002005530E|nr:hypothetical protein [Chitinophaga sedimenti]MCK7556970.1 hypothetical protein [Chitinophaga sedimenti]